MKTKSEQVAELINSIAKLTGWTIAIPKSKDGAMDGFCMGTDAYLDRVLEERVKSKKPKRMN